MVFSYCGPNIHTLHFAAVAPGHLQYLAALIRGVGAEMELKLGKLRNCLLERGATGRPKLGPKLRQ